MNQNSNKLEERIASLEERITSVEKALSLSKQSSEIRKFEKPLTISEFKLAYSPKTHDERALIIGAYLERHRDQKHFSIEDLRNGFKECKWSLPANLSDTIAKSAASKAIFMISETEKGKKLWTLTETGEKYLRGLREDEK